MHTRRWHTGLQLALLLALVSQVWGASLQIRDRLSSWSERRPVRRQTRYIILHTTEGGTVGSLEKLRRHGEAHYLVDEKGIVYRIMDRRRVALHAGRSMWENNTKIDEQSIGVEVTGYHNRDITTAQIRSLQLLLADLQRQYRIPDERVMPHSMVAYGSPNRWHRRSHRGRKRCAMQFADRALRQQLGLNRQPLFDPDVRAGRLIEADPYLASVLYGTARAPRESRGDVRAASTQPQITQAEGNIITRNRSAWDIARDQYQSETTIYLFPDGKEMRGNEIRDWRRLPAGTRVEMRTGVSENAAVELFEIGVHGQNARDLAGDEVLAATTIYFLVDGRVRQGSELSAAQVDALPAGTRMLVGYIHGGYVTARRTAFDIAGAKWNHPTTFYRQPNGTIVSGDGVSESAIVPMMMVFFQR
ncbi:MAG: N-acetylmuramoyl-L-alanine amidase [Kiritimatiellia bacterium]